MLASKVRFASGEPDFTVQLEEEGTLGAAFAQIKQHHGWHGRHVRLFCSGTELFPHDAASRASAPAVLLCIATDAPCARAAPKEAPGHHSVERPPTDWLDVIDPGTVLMWVFGSILAVLWVLLIFFANFFDRTSVAMLITMTVAFLVPAGLSCMPCLSHLSTHGYALALPSHGNAPEPAAPGMAVLPARTSTDAARAPHWQSWEAPGAIPPRPLASVRPAL